MFQIFFNRVMLFVLLVIANVITIVLTNPVLEWYNFKMKYNKTYVPDTAEWKAMEIYFDNKIMIEEHNKDYANGLTTFKMKINSYGDQTEIQVNKIMNQLEQDYMDSQFNVSSGKTLPARVDWRKKGAVTPVKNQGLCGACWAFSAVGSLEGQLAIQTGKLISLSEQNLVDCSTKNDGCQGGHRHEAFKYFIEYGINSEASYHYKAMKGQCKFSPSNVELKCKGFKKIQLRDEDSLKDAVANIGPVSVDIHAGQNYFHFYSEGIYDNHKCYSARPNHAVLVVGYGRENDIDYWLVKNSWGTDWGEQGYIKMVRNKNLCGIANNAIYPIIDV